MREKGLLGIMKKRDWNELVQLADEAERMVSKYGEAVCGRNLIQQMITAVRGHDIETLKRLSFAENFPFRENIRDALRSLIPNEV